MDKNEVSYLELVSKQCSFQKSLAFNSPYEYKGVKFYPVGLEFLMEFYTCVQVLTVRQEWVKDKKLMKLPYLWFLAYAFENQDKYENPEYGMYIPLLYALLELVTKSKNISIMLEHKDNGDFKKCNLVIDGVLLDYKDFNQIRKIILEQSGIECDLEEFINEDTYKALNDGKEFENKQNNYVPPTLENLIDILAMYLHKGTGEIIELFTIRKFNNTIRYMSTFEEWKLLKGAEMGGMVSFKQPIPHWISGFDKYDMFKNENTDYIKKNIT